jgi:hypothetical protein
MKAHQIAETIESQKLPGKSIMNIGKATSRMFAEIEEVEGNRIRVDVSRPEAREFWRRFPFELKKPDVEGTAVVDDRPPTCLSVRVSSQVAALIITRRCTSRRINLCHSA